MATELALFGTDYRVLLLPATSPIDWLCSLLNALMAETRECNYKS